uniref:Neur_chan_LBD domain-containing protein n=1 Tax=Panagrellus redivivus TaxID=6233 RepID=A0A7E4W1J8_PANRE
MQALLALFLFVGLLSGSLGELAGYNVTRGPDCSWKKNITDPDVIDAEQREILETCLYYYLLERDIQLTGDSYKLFLKAPWEYPLNINIDYVTIQQVDHSDKKSSEFNIHGDIFLSWSDDRLTWNTTEWKTDNFFLHDSHHIWTPLFTDESDCTTLDGCISKIMDVEVSSDGKVTAHLVFRYPGYCGINYHMYPEETNDCCVYLFMLETERKIEYKIEAKTKEFVDKAVAVTTLDKKQGMTVLTNVETSPWKVVSRVVDVVKIGGYRSQFLRICVNTKKSMSTLRVALRIPATIATLLMLASPLFGDLRTQIFVKLVTLLLQTVCFLFLVSIAPENGFAGIKPRIYMFYEFLFVNSTVSIIITLTALALCRLKRSVPPPHNVYLAAKLINRFICCSEPDETATYQRYLEDSRENGGIPEPNHQASDNTATYTTEWRQLYIAVNNLASGINFSIFMFIIICDIL